MNEPQKQNKNKLITAALAGAAVVAAVLALRFPRRAEAPPAAAEAAVPAFSLDAYVERARQWDAATGFDYAAHEAALSQVGPGHHAALAGTAQADAARRRRETALLQEDAEAAALADAADALRHRLAALRALQSGGDGEPAPAAAAEGEGAQGVEAELKERLARTKDELKAVFAKDAEWQTLHAAYEAAEAERAQALARLQAVIRVRMQVEHEIAQAKRKAEAGRQEEQP